MAKAKTTNELAKVESWPMLKVEPEQTAELLRANLGDEAEITERDLTRIKFPSGGAPVFCLDTEEGTETLQEIEGIILYAGSRRAFWDKPYGSGESGPPLCSSLNAKTGTGFLSEAEKEAWDSTKPVPTRICRTCPMAQYGTAKKPDGSQGDGQACGERRLLFLATEMSALPIVISLPPTSLGDYKKYAMQLAGKGRTIQSVVTRIGLAKKTNKGGTDYSQATFTKGGDLNDEQAAKLAALAASLSEVFQSVGIDEDDRPQGATVHGEVVDQTPEG
jgi:hypothetical protein